MSIRHKKWSTTEPFDVAARFEKVLNIGVTHIPTIKDKVEAPYKLDNRFKTLARHRKEQDRDEAGKALEEDAAALVERDHETRVAEDKIESVRRIHEAEKLAKQKQSSDRERGRVEAGRQLQNDATQRAKNIQEFWEKQTGPKLVQEDHDMIDQDSLDRINMAMTTMPYNTITDVPDRRTVTPSPMAGRDVSGQSSALSSAVATALSMYFINVPSDATAKVQTNMVSWKQGQVEILLFISRRLAKFREDFSNPYGERVRYAKFVISQFTPFVIDLSLNIYDTADGVRAVFTATITYTHDPLVFGNLVRGTVRRGSSLILRSYLEVAKVMKHGAVFFKDEEPGVTTPYLKLEDHFKVGPDGCDRIYLAMSQDAQEEWLASGEHIPSPMAGRAVSGQKNTLSSPVATALSMNSINVPDGATEEVRTNMELWKKGQVEILLFISQRLARLKLGIFTSNGKRVQKERIVVRWFKLFVVDLTLYSDDITDAFTATIRYTDQPADFETCVRLDLNRNGSLILTSYWDVAKVMASGASLFRDATPKEPDVLDLNDD